jgi:hypothetical protein
MITELMNFGRVHRWAFAGHEPPTGFASCTPAAPGSSRGLPQRPDASVISAAIPLFYIGRNRKGLWVAREAEGRSGGLFLTRRAAVRFAKESCEPAGCATMFVSQPLELDFDSTNGSAAPARVENAYAAGTSSAWTIVDATVRAVRKLAQRISHAIAAERRHRQALERDLFGGRYTLCSKNDDDFPVAR